MLLRDIIIYFLKIRIFQIIVLQVLMWLLLLGESLKFCEVDDLNQIYLTGVPFSSPDILDSVPVGNGTLLLDIYIYILYTFPCCTIYMLWLDLPSLICYTDEFMPGSVLQSLSPDPAQSWKSHLQVKSTIIVWRNIYNPF